MKTRIARDVATARRPGRPIPAAMGTAGVAQAEADRARVRTVLRAPSDWRAPAPVPRLSALKVGAVNDPLEHDANRIADQVMQEKVQKQSTTPDVGDRRAPESVSRALRSPGQPLDTSSRGYFEPRFGHDFSGVRVHSDAGAAQSARDINARAYTVGNNIVFGAGRFAPGAAAGRQLLAHELAHVVQNTAARGADTIRRTPDPPPEPPAKIVSRVWNVEGRPVVVVEFNGRRKAFYERSGDSPRPEGHAGPQESDWAPFDGWQPSTKAKGSGHFVKENYHRGFKPKDPLHGYGNEKNKQVAKWLGEQKLECPATEQPWEEVQAELEKLGVKVRRPLPPRGTPGQGGTPAPNRASHVEFDPDREPPAAPTGKSAEDLGIKPGSKLDTEVGRANRAEQAKRAADYSIDQFSVQGGKQPGGKVVEPPKADATARARAADYAQLYSRWGEGPDARRELMKNIINAQLAREGIPPADIKFGAKSRGSAEFSPGDWKMALSAASMDEAHISIEHFSILVENAVHETQHAVTNFRGLRMALALERFNPATVVPGLIVDAARAANARQHPNRELDPQTRREALEIYRVSMDPRRATGEAVPEGGVDRSAVTARHDESVIDLAEAKTAHLKKQEELAADPADPILQRELRVAKANLDDAKAAFIKAHNAYMALPEETVSWRAGTNVKVAMAERLALEMDYANAMERANVHAAEQGRLAKAGDADGATAALARRNDELQLADAIQKKIDGLTPAEARKVGGRVMRREIPLSQKEVDEAPRAPAKGYTDDDFGPGPGSSARKPAPSPKVSATEALEPTGTTPPTPKPKPAAQGETTAPTGVALPKAAAVVAPGPETPVGARREVNVSPTGDAIFERVTETDTATGTKQAAVGATIGPSEIGVGARSTQIPTAGGGRKETYAKASITAQGVGTEVGNLKTSPTGTTRGAVGGVKFDEKGNPTLEAGYLIQGKSGSSIKPTFSQGRRVDASEPEPQPDGSFLVRYTVTDTTTVGIGGEAKRTQAGMGVGGSISSFDASANSGTRRFTDKKEAEKFQKNAATMLNFTQGTQVPRSAADVKDIAVGELRGSSQTEGTATSLSASYSGFSIGRNTTESTTHGLSVERISDKVVNVTTNVTTEKAKEWAASGLFLTNAKGKSSSHGFSVVLQFDLSTTPGQKGFDFYMATGIPAMGGWKNIGETTIDTQASYDRYSIPLLGTAEWREPEWESDTIGEQGRGHEIGGGQEHQQDPTWLARKTGDRKLFSSAQLIYRETEEKESYTAVIRVKSESGDYNQDEFAKAFFGAHATHDAQPSGEWIISAEISKRAVEDIAALRDRAGLARTSRDKARMMTKLMTERGGQMAGGLMRSGAKKTDWMVELKGDPNFPGAAGRAKLDAEKKALSDGLKADPTSGPAVARRAEEIIAALNKRREAVADKTKYTDLPTELRDQQLELIDLHKNQFSALRQTAIQGAMKSKPGEKIEDIQKRTTRRDWHKDLKGDERTYAKLQDVVALKENERKEVDKLVGTYSRALGDVWNPNGRFAARENIRLSTAGPLLEETKSYYELAMAMDKRAAELGPNLRKLREAWLAVAQSHDIKVKLQALQAFDKVLDEHIEFRRLCIKFIREAATTINPIITERSRQGSNRAFWNSLGPPDDAR